MYSQRGCCGAGAVVFDGDFAGVGTVRIQILVFLYFLKKFDVHTLSTLLLPVSIVSPETWHVLLYFYWNWPAAVLLHTMVNGNQLSETNLSNFCVLPSPTTYNSPLNTMIQALSIFLKKW